MNRKSPVTSHLAVFPSSKLSSIAITNLRNVKSYIFCPHCNKLLAKKTFKGHQKLYFDDVSQSWTSMEQLQEGNSNSNFNANCNT